MTDEQFEDLKSEIEGIYNNTAYGAINYNELLTTNKRLQNIEYWLEENHKLMKELIFTVAALKK